MSTTIHAIHIGQPREVAHGKQLIKTSIFKEPTDKRVEIHSLGIKGDTQSDLVNHGGVDKALCAYSYDRYSFWEEKLDQPIGYSAFGENITLYGWLEEEVHIGDVFELGSAVVQISQPRHPCYKLGIKHQQPKMPLWVKETGYSGFYFRVLKEGGASVQDDLKRIESYSHNPTVMEVNRCRNNPDATIEELTQMIEIKELASEWIEAFTKKRDQI
ncbi:MOSC domain-containing protein [Alkalihalophilus pseudofirmus]|uniref:MOSC domain-containing protein n=1 Tax=Alkalihalophilus pseudofirmus TaxID=79885 RepID=A0AAJ2U427_ALKPS|nr:MOSC domain-containing protein [Alkalihalophilus pseudofirmus]MDV2886782.1 MOSC domain-containing protein [Alkalihalophilus pseudofirmus]